MANPPDPPSSLLCMPTLSAAILIRLSPLNVLRLLRTPIVPPSLQTPRTPPRCKREGFLQLSTGIISLGSFLVFPAIYPPPFWLVVARFERDVPRSCHLVYLHQASGLNCGLHGVQSIELTCPCAFLRVGVGESTHKILCAIHHSETFVFD